MGVFDAESSWRPPDLARLPGVEFSRSRDLIATMDELLFPWQDRSGLVTLLPLVQAQLQYFSEICPGRQTLSVYSSPAAWLAAGSPSSLFNAIRHNKELLAAINGCALDPYAVLPLCNELAEEIGSNSRWPNQEIIARVNSKSFSAALTERHCPNVQITVIHSISELRHFVHRYSQPILVKDPFGVSGKGQYLIRKAADLDRLAVHLKLEEERGRHIEFVAESFTPFLFEFGTYFYLHPDGTAEPRGARITLNQGSRYAGSVQPDRQATTHIQSPEHRQTLEIFLDELHRAGYYGPICIDSAVLEDHSLRSVLEINARHSMGSLSVSFEQAIAQPHGLVSSWKVVETKELSRFLYPEILERMDTRKFLWRPGSTSGILPLTSRSLNPRDEPLSETLSARRWFFAVLAPTADLCLRVERSFLTWLEAGLPTHHC